MAERLRSDEIHPWIATLDAPAEQFEPLLDAAERRFAARLTTDSLLRRFVVRRGLRRAVLMLYADQPPTRLRFIHGPHGKPRLAGSRVRFSCAASGGLALIAIARDRPIGADVERLRRVRGALDIADCVFTPHERAELQAVAGGRRDAAFLRTWTRMEASVKAHGTGLAAAVRTPAAGSPVRRRVQSLQPAPGHVGAVAEDGFDWQISWRMW